METVAAMEFPALHGRSSRQYGTHPVEHDLGERSDELQEGDVRVALVVIDPLLPARLSMPVQGLRLSQSVGG